MGSQGLDPHGGRALVGLSGGTCSPHGPGELGPGAQPGTQPVPPRRQHHAPAGKHGITLALIKGLSALALLDKQNRAERIQRLGRGPLGVSAPSQAPLCPVSGSPPERTRHPVPTACPQPCRLPHHGQAPASGIQAARGGIRHQKKAGRNAESPHHLFRTAAAPVPCSARRSERRPMALLSISPQRSTSPEPCAAATSAGRGRARPCQERAEEPALRGRGAWLMEPALGNPRETGARPSGGSTCRRGGERAGTWSRPSAAHSSTAGTASAHRFWQGTVKCLLAELAVSPPDTPLVMRFSQRKGRA